MFRITKQLILIISIFILAGCASNTPQKMYSGPKKPQSELALIAWNNQAVKHGYHGVHISEIDGQETSLFSGGKAWVLSGQHQVKQKCFNHYNNKIIDGKVRGLGESTINLEPGKRYFFQGKVGAVTKFKIINGHRTPYKECMLSHWEI